MANYAHPEVLVDTSWVKGNIGNETVRIVEVDYDPTPNYNLGHIPGAVLIDWKKDINDPVNRDIVSKEGLEALFGRLGISNDHQIILYGDFNNWFAAFASDVPGDDVHGAGTGRDGPGLPRVRQRSLQAGGQGPRRCAWPERVQR